MSVATKSLLLTTVLALLAVLGAAAQNSPSPSNGRGEEWLSWTSAQRVLFVGAYLQGYQMGTLDACAAAAELFESGKKITDLNQDPDRRCVRHAKRYSLRAADYARVITAFYHKHPEYRRIPIDYFMILFTDRRYQTLGGIEQGIQKGDVRTTF